MEPRRNNDMIYHCLQTFRIYHVHYIFVGTYVYNHRHRNRCRIYMRLIRIHHLQHHQQPCHIFLGILLYHNLMGHCRSSTWNLLYIYTSFPFVRFLHFYFQHMFRDLIYKLHGNQCQSIGIFHCHQKLVSHLLIQFSLPVSIVHNLIKKTDANRVIPTRPCLSRSLSMCDLTVKRSNDSRAPQ